MTTIFDLKGLLKSARDDLSIDPSIMLNKDCQEIFGIAGRIDELAGQFDKGTTSTTIAIGLYAVVYYLAGVSGNVANITLLVDSYLNRKSKRAATKSTGPAKAYKPLLRKVLECQEIITCFADGVLNNYCDPMLHISSQIMVLLEHPGVMPDSEPHRRLSYELELIEGLSSRVFDIQQRFENHALLKIDVSLIPGGLVH
ncbi:MAG: hypothetical protein Q8L79_07630 [Methylobacter sp.]|uniref:hypothetical protein n=1 Tax=Methylobacter sp. TaxID=2051955 RepID=UPI0027316570|nr:hypothetical protein [Methylobacter sp.]MDP1664983.1 hypothetical protein [Methylobacter sp.]